MSTPVGIWQVTASGPQRLAAGEVGLEKNLEDWIEHDPGLLQAGLTIVGRQIVTEGGRLDLLAVDQQGQWVVIEIKAGAVRRDTIAQALDYASCVAQLPMSELERRVNGYLERHRSRAGEFATLSALMEDLGTDVSEADESDRPVRIFVVGTGRDPGLERMVNYLSGQGDIEIAVVSFEVFRTAAGEHVLTRELTEADADVVARRESSSRRRITVEDLFRQAKEHGTEAPFRMMYDAATRLGLYPRLWAKSIMYAPPTNRSRCLVVIWPKLLSDGRIKCYAEPTAFEEFYGIAPERVRAELPGDERGRMAPEEMSQFVEGLERLLSTAGDEEV